MVCGIPHGCILLIYKLLTDGMIIFEKGKYNIFSDNEGKEDYSK